jgi:hypothetical protein
MSSGTYGTTDRFLVADGYLHSVLSSHCLEIIRTFGRIFQNMEIDIGD